MLVGQKLSTSFRKYLCKILKNIFCSRNCCKHDMILLGKKHSCHLLSKFALFIRDTKFIQVLSEQMFLLYTNINLQFSVFYIIAAILSVGFQNARVLFMLIFLCIIRSSLNKISNISNYDFKSRYSLMNLYCRKMCSSVERLSFVN